ncbi:hypothetical protein D3C84_670510 [compost metagenome]
MISAAPAYRLSRGTSLSATNASSAANSGSVSSSACTWDGLRYSMALVVQKKPRIVGSVASASSAAIASGDSSPIAKPSAAAGISRYRLPKNNNCRVKCSPPDTPIRFMATEKAP